MSYKYHIQIQSKPTPVLFVSLSDPFIQEIERVYGDVSLDSMSVVGSQVLNGGTDEVSGGISFDNLTVIVPQVVSETDEVVGQFQLSDITIIVPSIVAQSEQSEGLLSLDSMVIILPQTYSAETQDVSAGISLDEMTVA